jgi:hypothetical protein
MMGCMHFYREKNNNKQSKDTCCPDKTAPFPLEDKS